MTVLPDSSRGGAVAVDHDFVQSNGHMFFNTCAADEGGLGAVLQCVDGATANVPELLRAMRVGQVQSLPMAA